MRDLGVKQVRERDGAATGSALWTLRYKLATHLCHGASDVEGHRLQVEVATPQSQQLTPSQRPEHRQEDQEPEPRE